MKDPTPLVEHVYEAYVETFCNVFNPACVDSNAKTQRRLLAQGKDIFDVSLFNILYTESIVPLFGSAHYNQFVCINESDEGEIDTPSKMYVFSEMSEDDVPFTKFAEQNGSEEAPDCIMWIIKPESAAVKSLYETCCKISKLQPVTHLMIEDVICQHLTPEKDLTLSRNIQGVHAVNCNLPMRFWKKILHQLFDCVNLRSLWFANTNLHQLEQDLDKLFKNLDRTGLTKHQVWVVLKENKFSQKFVNKWNRTSTGISCKFDDNSFHVPEFGEDEDGLALDEINWLSREVHPGIEMNLSGENITAAVVNDLEISEPVEQLILRDCSISDGAVIEAFMKLFTHNFLTVLDLSGTKLGHNAMHISYIVAHGNFKQLHLPHCEIPPMALDHILLVLPSCKELTHLNLCGNNLEASGHHVAEFIVALGDEPTLKELNLGHCSMTREACRELLLVLGTCKSLNRLNISGNSIQGCLNWFLSQSHEGLHSLQELTISKTGLNRDDLLHLTELLDNKLTCLSQLDLGNNSLHRSIRIKDALINLVQFCVTNRQRKLQLKLGFNNLSPVLMQKITSLCSNTSTELGFKLKGPAGYEIDIEMSDTNTQVRSESTDYAWRADEFLLGFYNDVDDKEEVHKE